MKKFIYLMAVCLPLSGCSSLYSTGQNYQYHQCIDSAATPQQRRDCEDIYDTSYKEYQTQRQTVIDQE